MSRRTALRLTRWVAITGAALLLSTGLASAQWLRARGLSLEDLQSELRQGGDPRFEWRSVNRKHWQVVGVNGDGAGEGAAANAEAALPEDEQDPACPAGMARVKGDYLSGIGPGSAEVERLQDSACVEWISKDFPARCKTFDPEKIASGLDKIKTRPIDVCVDRYEYPNVAGEYPIIVVTFREAEALCKGDGKRLCTEDEWTFACEGEEAWPYPYGFSRDPAACVVDRSWRAFSEGALYPRDGERARAELDRLWQGEASGARPECRSPFGVHDLTGNVDEWTRSTRSSGYPSILKGGYWGPIRARCRPSTRAHGEDFVAYQQGFRCCAEPDLAASAAPPVDEADEEPPPPEDAALEAAPPDAGPSTTSTTSATGEPSATSEPSEAATSDDAPGRAELVAVEEGDELEAIARRRAGIACAVTGPRGEAGAPRLAAGGALAFAALGLFARRQRGRAQ